jgi:histidyl-tRNA synthetase
MNLKRKKNIATFVRQPVLTEVPQSTVVAQDLAMDNLLKKVENLGFQQVLPSPVEERSVFVKHPELQRHFGDKILEVSDGRFQHDLVLNPTHFLSILKRYARNVKLHGPHVAKWFYLSPVLEINDGKLASSHELGMFILGEDSGLAHAQLIDGVSQVFNAFGIKDFVVEVNCLGCKLCQKDYQGMLQEYLRKVHYELCPESASDLETNPMAIWRCENPACQALLSNAPQIVDFLDESCRATLVGVLETLDSLGIVYTLKPSLSLQILQQKMIFRVTVNEGKTILGAGGNYGSFAVYLGHDSEVPLLGFLTSFEKFWQLIPEESRKIGSHVEVFMVPLGEMAARPALLLQRALQQAGISAEEAILGNSSIKNQLKEAVDRHTDITLIIGQKEALDETIILRDMRSGIQEVFARDRIIEEVKKRLGK